MFWIRACTSYLHYVYRVFKTRFKCTFFYFGLIDSKVNIFAYSFHSAILHLSVSVVPHNSLVRYQKLLFRWTSLSIFSFIIVLCSSTSYHSHRSECWDFSRTANSVRYTTRWPLIWFNPPVTFSANDAFRCFPSTFPPLYLPPLYFWFVSLHECFYWAFFLFVGAFYSL